MTLKTGKIHCLCLIKNEADIIEHLLRETVKWADFIYIYDNGSTDGSWEKVLSLKSEQIIPWKQDSRAYRRAIRGEIFNEFRNRASLGDWWCCLDADEFFVDNPREFLSEVPSINHVVWGVSIEYYITREDLENIDFKLPVKKVLPQLRSYKVSNSELRFFRHRDGLVWRETDTWPVHLGLVYPTRVLYRHYKYRSPEQIKNRLETRRVIGSEHWDSASEDNWTDRVESAKDLQYDSGDSEYIYEESKLPNHLASTPKRILKRVMHGLHIWP